jgi:hypothetical protein
MHEDTVRTKAFAMPLTNPAYPIGPYRFRSREYLIVTYRTAPHKLREIVPVLRGALAVRLFPAKRWTYAQSSTTAEIRLVYPGAESLRVFCLAQPRL